MGARESGRGDGGGRGERRWQSIAIEGSREKAKEGGTVAAGGTRMEEGGR